MSFFRRFRAEDGALLPLSLYFFITLMFVTGIAVDFIRQEEARQRVQNTLDRAVLAAASLSQKLDPEEVVNDYLEKAGLGDQKVTITVEQGMGLSWRRVSASMSGDINTIFGKMLGIDTLGFNGASTAYENIGNVEISLVLDVSGSMSDKVSGGTRISKLQEAAKSFIGTMFDSVDSEDEGAGRLSMSIIPYNQQVQLGTTLASAFNLSTEQTGTTCADVMTLSTDKIAIDLDNGLQRTMYGDSFDYWGNDWTPYQTVSTAASSNIANCLANSANEILVWSDDEAALKNKIGSLVAKGDTAIDIGARWGLGLLAPEAQGALTRLINKGVVNTDLEGRPLAYSVSSSESDTDKAMKVMVLMTDGENTRSYSTQMAYRTGDSGFRSKKSATAFPKSFGGSCRNSTSDWCSLYYYASGKTKPYYRLADKTWYSAKDVGTTYTIDWATVWNTGFTMQYLIENVIGPARYAAYNEAYTTVYANMAIQSEYAQKDTDLKNICDVAKDDEHGVYIFTVAVDAATNGQAILAECATNAGYAYTVDSGGLNDAFASIASSISALRLTN